MLVPRKSDSRWLLTTSGECRTSAPILYPSRATGSTCTSIVPEKREYGFWILVPERGQRRASSSAPNLSQIFAKVANSSSVNWSTT